MTELVFTVRFLAPFAIATGVARDGMDTSIDPANPLPSTAIKGLLKAQLRDMLEEPRTSKLDAIFNGGEQLGWVFHDGTITAPDGEDKAPEVGLWTRVKVDAGGKSEERMLMLGEQAGAVSGRFAISWEGPGDAPPDHVRALRAAARCVTSLGSHRRRGLGWVAITDTDEWTADDSAKLREWLDDKAGVA